MPLLAPAEGDKMANECMLCACARQPNCLAERIVSPAPCVAVSSHIPLVIQAMATRAVGLSTGPLERKNSAADPPQFEVCALRTEQRAIVAERLPVSNSHTRRADRAV